MLKSPTTSLSFSFSFSNSIFLFSSVSSSSSSHLPNLPQHVLPSLIQHPLPSPLPLPCPPVYSPHPLSSSSSHTPSAYDAFIILQDGTGLVRQKQPLVHGKAEEEEEEEKEGEGRCWRRRREITSAGSASGVLISCLGAGPPRLSLGPGIGRVPAGFPPSFLPSASSPLEENRNGTGSLVFSLI